MPTCNFFLNTNKENQAFPNDNEEKVTKNRLPRIIKCIEEWKPDPVSSIHCILNELVHNVIETQNQLCHRVGVDCIVGVARAHTRCTSAVRIRESRRSQHPAAP